MPRVLIAEAHQEISTFNHVFYDYDFFTKMWAVRLKRWSMHRSRESEIRPAWYALGDLYSYLERSDDAAEYVGRALASARERRLSTSTRG